MRSRTTNPAGKHGKPITLPPMSFDDALRKMLAASPPKHEPKAAKQSKKPAKRKR